MNRQQKEQVIENLKEDFLKSQATFIVDYKGLDVAKMQNLRSELRQRGGLLKVAKIRLMRRAVEGQVDIDQLSIYFKDQIGLVFAKEHFSEVAKVLSDFSKENEALNVVVGYLENQIIDKGRISYIASLPPKEVLLGQLCGTLNAPISGFVRALNMIILKLLFALKQVGDQKK